MSEQNLSPEVANQVQTTYPAMLNNFRKITSWLKLGTASEHKLPDVVLNFLTKVDGMEQTITEQVGKLNTLAEIVENYEASIRSIQENNVALTEALQKQAEVIAELSAKLDNAGATETPKKRGKKAEPQPEPQPEPVVEAPKDKVVVTAEAVNAGDVSPEGFAQIDGIIDGLFAGAVPPQPTTSAPSVADLDEL